MSITTLFADEGAWVASERLVYTAEERGALESAAAQAAGLGTLVATREAELERARDAGLAEGVEQGRREGREAVAAELGAALSALRDTVETERRAHRDALVELSLGVVRRLVGDIEGPERLSALARVAVAELVDEPRLVLHVHPSMRDALDPTLAPADDELSPAVGTGRRVRPFDGIVADHDLQPDEAWIETPGGRIAIDLDTQLDAVRDQLLSRPDVLGALAENAA